MYHGIPVSGQIPIVLVLVYTEELVWQGLLEISWYVTRINPQRPYMWYDEFSTISSMPRPEVLQRVKEAEQEADEIIAQAKEDKKERLTEARDRAKKIRQEAEAEAREHKQKRLEEAREKIEQERKQIVEEGAEEREAIESAASQRMDDVVNHVIELIEEEVHAQT